jgi:hypothetical protein
MTVFREMSPTLRRNLQFLKRELSSGSKVAVRQIHQTARTNRIPPRSLTEARKFLRVVVTQTDGIRFWQMPLD